MNEFERLYHQHASAVFRFAWGLCGDRAAAEDLVSETFVRVLTRAPRIETSTALAYLLAVARNVHRSSWRRRRREVPLEDDLLAPEPDLARRLDERAEMQRVQRALAKLSEAEREALLLRVDHELPYDEIAAALGISLSAAKVRVHRARLRLTAALATPTLKEKPAFTKKSTRGDSTNTEFHLRHATNTELIVDDVTNTIPDRHDAANGETKQDRAANPDPHSGDASRQRRRTT